MKLITYRLKMQSWMRPVYIRHIKKALILLYGRVDAIRVSGTLHTTARKDRWVFAEFVTVPVISVGHKRNLVIEVEGKRLTLDLSDPQHGVEFVYFDHPGEKELEL